MSLKFETLVGQVFFEDELYELLLEEIEDNFDNFYSKFIHIYFDRVEIKKIRVTQIAFFKDSKEINQVERKLIEKREWFHIGENDNHFNLLLCRFDRTGFLSSIWKDKTRTEEWAQGWADELPELGRPMTPEEIRQGFRELMGIFEDQQEKQELRNKKAV